MFWKLNISETSWFLAEIFIVNSHLHCPRKKSRQLWELMCHEKNMLHHVNLIFISNGSQDRWPKTVSPKCGSSALNIFIQKITEWNVVEQINEMSSAFSLSSQPRALTYVTFFFAAIWNIISMASHCKGRNSKQIVLRARPSRKRKFKWCMKSFKFSSYF